MWSDFNENSENSIKMKNTKMVNGPDYWPIMREVFAYDLKTLPLTHFRHWASVNNVPLATSYRTFNFLASGFTAAIKDKEYFNALQENWIGVDENLKHQFFVADDFNTSMQRLQNLSHLYTCGFTPNILKDCKSIIEIGGGYGDMCSLVHALGFKGKYFIYDFPEVQSIQKYYLEHQGINASYINMDNIGELAPCDLVIATWSLSEIPIIDREPIMSRIYISNKWLVMYQAKIFGSVDNTEYFKILFPNANFFKLNETHYDGDNTYMVIK